MACGRENVTADAAGRIGIFPPDRLSVRRVGVDIAAKLAGQILHVGKDSASNHVALDTEARQETVSHWLSTNFPMNEAPPTDDDMDIVGNLFGLKFEGDLVKLFIQVQDGYFHHKATFNRFWITDLISVLDLKEA